MGSVMNVSVVDVVCYKHVCYELLCNERSCNECGLLCTWSVMKGGLFWTGQ